MLVSLECQGWVGRERVEVGFGWHVWREWVVVQLGWSVWRERVVMRFASVSGRSKWR